MGVTRRGFLKAIFAAAAAPAIVRADSLMKIVPRNMEVFTWHEEPIVINQLRDLEFFDGTQWSEVQIDAMNVRALARANLAAWFQMRVDELHHDLLIERVEPKILLPEERRIILPGEE